MRKFMRLDGLAAPLDRANVGTDVIIPKQYWNSIKRSGLGPKLFDDWRYSTAAGSQGVATTSLKK